MKPALQCPFEGCGFDLKGHQDVSPVMPTHTRQDGVPCAGGLCSISFAFQATQYAADVLARVDELEKDRSCSSL